MGARIADHSDDAEIASQPLQTSGRIGRIVEHRVLQLAAPLQVAYRDFAGVNAFAKTEDSPWVVAEQRLAIADVVVKCGDRLGQRRAGFDGLARVLGVLRRDSECDHLSIALEVKTPRR